MSTTLQSFKLDKNGDLDLSTNKIQIISGIEYVRQLITVRLKFFLGEWYLNTELGIPYIQYVFQKGSQIDTVISILKKVVLDTSHVVSVPNFDIINYNNKERTLQLSFNAIVRIDDEELELNYDEELTI